MIPVADDFTASEALFGKGPDVIEMWRSSVW